MIRNCSLEDISDGRLYSENDMVKADTNHCQGCQSVCCHGMGQSILLDPYDIYRLTKELGVPFEKLLENNLELNVVDGVILPNLKMTGEKEQCSFLNEQQRCMIHQARPGICRLFPLGRFWEDETHFQYILQKGQCHKDNLTKIKVKKWLDTKDLEQYNGFVIRWHQFLRQVQAAEKSLSEEHIKVLTMYILRAFFSTPYDEREFYVQFEERMKKARTDLAMD